MEFPSCPISALSSAGAMPYLAVLGNQWICTGRCRGLWKWLNNTFMPDQFYLLFLKEWNVTFGEQWNYCLQLLWTTHKNQCELLSLPHYSLLGKNCDFDKQWWGFSGWWLCVTALDPRGHCTWKFNDHINSRCCLTPWLQNPSNKFSSMLYCLHRHAAGFSMLLFPASLLVLCLNHCSRPQLRKGGHGSEHK